jgi:hypothetical protein
MVNRNHIETMAPQSLKDWRYLRLKHGDVARYGGVLIGASERCPRIEAHPCIDRGSHLFHRKIVPADCDFVDSAALFTFVSHDLPDFGRI